VTAITVVTAIYGGYDTLKTPPAQDIDVEWICVTDDPNLVSDGTWQIRYEPRSPEVGPRLAAKVPKCMPWTYSAAVIDDPSRPVIWMDASFLVKNSHSIAGLVEASDAHKGSVWQFIHPNRDCIFTEADFSAGLPKYVHQPIQLQAMEYKQAGHPEAWGLWATGLIVYRAWSLHVITARSWLIEQLRWTNQDQVSQPYVWHRHGQRPRELPGALLVNEFVTLLPHLDGT
jgi:hypothetical protein